MSVGKLSVESFQRWKSLEVPDPSNAKDSKVVAIAWNSSGTRVAYSKTDKTLAVLRFNGTTVYTIESPPDTHDVPVESICWGPDSDGRFATVGREPTIKIWDCSQARFKLINNVKLDNTDENILVSYSSCGKLLAVVNRAGTISVLNAKKGYQLMGRLTHAREYVYSITWAASSDVLLAALSTGDVRLYSVRQFKRHVEMELIYTIRGHRSAATSVTYDPLGRFIAVGTNEGTVSLWDTQTLVCVKTLTSVDEPIGSIDFSACGQFLAVTYEYDSPAKVFKVDTLEEVFEMKSCVGGKTIPQTRFNPVYPVLVQSDTRPGKCIINGESLSVATKPERSKRR